MELDHIFFLIDPDGPEPGLLERLGLRESYRRDHTGQGTRNVCYCFDNLYVELLWLSDPEAARSPPIARTRLFERSTWRSTGTCPIGLAWRSGTGTQGFRGETWTFRPPYLPGGAGISVSVDSDDPFQPMLFESPGKSGPLEWPPDRRGSLQHHLGLTTVRRVGLHCPRRISPSPGLSELCAGTIVDPAVAESDTWMVSIDVCREGGGERRFTLPPDSGGGI